MDIDTGLREIEMILRSMTFDACACGCGQAIHFNVREGNDKLHKALTVLQDLHEECKRRAKETTKEIFDGGTNYPDLHTDNKGRTWNLLVRQGGSISLYATAPGFGGHMIAYDTLDGEPPSELAQQVIGHLSDKAEGIGLLLNAVQVSSALSGDNEQSNLSNV